MTQPIYKRIIDALKKEIDNLSPNSPIMSERELAQKYDASRMTVRKAIGILEEEGFLYRDGNVGTFVADHNLRKTLKDQNIDQLFNGVTSYRILYFDVKSNNPLISKNLDIQPEDMYIRIVRINTNDKNVSELEEIYIVRKYIEDLDMSNIKSLLSYSASVSSGSMRQEYSAVIVPIIYANLLKIKPDTPIVKVESTVYLKSGKTYAYIVSYKHPEHSKIQMVF